MKYKLLIFMLCIFAIPMIMATEMYPINKDVTLKFTCTSNGQIPVAPTFNLTVSYPNGSVFINNKAATSVGNGAFTYNTIFKETGKYKLQMFCYEGTNSYSSEEFYEITPTGNEQTSILDNPILLVLGIVGTIILIFAIIYGMSFMGFISSIIFLLLGIYTMIYGFNNTIDMYTRGTALVFLGIGMFVMFASAYDWAFGGREDE